MIEISPNKRVFSLEEVQELLPVISRITDQALQQTEEAKSRYGDLTEADPEKEVLDRLLLDIVRAWVVKVRKLGAYPEEAWKVAFFEEQGYFLWEFQGSVIQYVSATSHSDASASFPVSHGEK